MKWDLAQHRFMVIPCGKYAAFYDLGCLPAGWTDCTELSDAAVGELMYLRAKKHAGF